MQQLTWMSRYFARAIYHQLRSVPRQVTRWGRFWKEYSVYRQMITSQSMPTLKDIAPYINDATSETEIEPVYFYQDAWAFEKIVQLSPALHVDVGSHHKFVALLSKVIPLIMVDIRPLSLAMASIKFQQGSILSLPFADGELQSLSSICVVEHIGLGRYGDPLDPDGSEKAFAELKRVVAPGGHLFISVPVGERNKVIFNAARVFSRDYLYQQFAPFEICDERYIVGNSFQDTYAPVPPLGTTGLYELVRPRKDH